MRTLITAALTLVACFVLATMGAAAPVVDSVDLGVPSWGLGADDFNRDGRLDFVNRGTDGTVYLFLNNGDGTFTKSTVATGILNDGGDIAAGDFNSDGWPDIVYTNFSDTLYLLLNLHDNTFSPATKPTGRWELYGVDCGDFDSDGLQDIFVIAYNTRTVLVVKGDGLGQFAVVDTFIADPDNVMTGGVPAVTAGDFNKDGWLDLVVGQDDDDRPGDTWFYVGDGSGQFTYVGLSYDTNPLESSGTDRAGSGRGDAFDFDGDGNLDIFAASASGFPQDSGAMVMFKSSALPIFGSCDTIGVWPHNLNVCSAPPLGFRGTEVFGIVAGPFSQYAYLARFQKSVLIAEDWESGTVDALKWQENGAGTTVTSGGLASDHAACFGSTSWGDSKSRLSLTFCRIRPEIDFWARSTGTGGWNNAGVSLEGPAGTAETYLGIYIRPEAEFRTLECYVPGQVQNVPYPSSKDGVWHHFNMMTNLDGSISFRMDENLLWTSAPIVWPGSASSWRLRAAGYHDLDTTYVDNIRLINHSLESIPGDGDFSCAVDVSDLSLLVDYLFFGGFLADALLFDVDGSCSIDISDLGSLVDYLFFSNGSLLQRCSGKRMFPKTASHLEVSTSLSGTSTLVELTSQEQIRGLYLELIGQGSCQGTNLSDPGLELTVGRVDGVLRVGLLDLNGGTRIPAGNRAVLRLDGEYQIVRALVSDENHQTIVATIGSVGKESTLPTSFALSQNYPNPFNPNTQISFDLPVASHATLSVYNLLGQQVRVLVDGSLEAGSHLIEWDGRGSDGQPVASGVYLYRLQAGEFVETRKMMLLK